MKIGITGATGQLGRLIVEKLKESTSAHQLVALARSPQNATDLSVEVREFDYSKTETLPASLQGIDRLILVSSNEIGQRAVQHAAVIEAAKSAYVQWIVYTSILHADTTSINLAGEHLATEQALKRSGINYTILRNGWYTENYLGSLSEAIQAGAFIGCAGDGKISSASRADFAEAAAAVIGNEKYKGTLLELAGDTAYTLSDLAAELSKQTGKTIPYSNLPEPKYAEILKGFGLAKGLADAIASWDTGVSKGDLFDDAHALSRLIGRPTTPMTHTLKAALTKVNV